MRSLSNLPRVRKDEVGKENMSKNVVGSTLTMNQVDQRVSVQLPLTFRRLNCQTVQSKSEKKVKPDITNEDFSFDKLKGTVEEFEKQQTRKKQLKYKCTNPDMKETDSMKNGTHTKMGLENLTMDTDESEKQSVQKVSREKPFASVSKIKNPSVVVKDKVSRPRLSPESRFTSNTSKRCYTRYCEKSKRCDDNSLQSSSSFQTFTQPPCTSRANALKPCGAYSERKVRMSQRRPTPEGDRITPDGDLISLISECSSRSPRNMQVVVQDEVNSTINSTATSTISSRHDSEPTRKQNRLPNDSENDKIYLTFPRRINEDNIVVTTNDPKADRSSYTKQDVQINRLSNQSSQMAALNSPGTFTSNDTDNDEVYLKVPHLLVNKNSIVATTNHPKVDQSSSTRRDEQAKRLSKQSSQIKSRSFNPSLYRFKPRIKKEEVEATDNKNASVRKISQWLGNDPFGNKKQVVLIRQGTKIMTKSKLFENEDVLKMRREEIASEKELQHFPAGKVSQGKKWLQTAFVEEKEDDDRDSGLKKKSRVSSRCERKKQHLGPTYLN